MLVCVAVTSACPKASLEDDAYEQRITVRFRDAEAAALASFALVPLYNGHKRAVSCRWDDNWTSDNPKTRDVMQRFGIRGTWYLNDRRFHSGMPDGVGEDYLPVAKRLLNGGTPSVVTH